MVNSSNIKLFRYINRTNCSRNQTGYHSLSILMGHIVTKMDTNVNYPIFCSILFGNALCVNRTRGILGNFNCSAAHQKTRRWGFYVGIIEETITPRPSSIDHLHHENIFFPLRSPAESIRKAKVAPEVRAIRGGEKPTDLLGK